MSNASEAEAQKNAEKERIANMTEEDRVRMELTGANWRFEELMNFATQSTGLTPQQISDKCRLQQAVDATKNQIVVLSVPPRLLSTKESAGPLEIPLGSSHSMQEKIDYVQHLHRNLFKDAGAMVAERIGDMTVNDVIDGLELEKADEDTPENKQFEEAMGMLLTGNRLNDMKTLAKVMIAATMLLDVGQGATVSGMKAGMEVAFKEGDRVKDVAEFLPCMAGFVGSIAVALEMLVKERANATQ